MSVFRWAMDLVSWLQIGCKTLSFLGPRNVKNPQLDDERNNSLIGDKLFHGAVIHGPITCRYFSEIMNRLQFIRRKCDKTANSLSTRSEYAWV